ncbi:hypothetical protein HMPREF3036_02144 [Sutterella sp. KLE1602]|nr:hypothetical protein HMPREF3036_02144 [Sutterella sp. KLE1602]
MRTVLCEFILIISFSLYIFELRFGLQRRLLDARPCRSCL